MSQLTNARQDTIRTLFAVFAVIAAADIALIAFSDDYRNFFGEVHSVPDVLWRIIPDSVMVLFYGSIYWRMKKGIVFPRLMRWHGVLFGLLGLVMCLPWGGYFFAPFSPVGLLYLGSILWIPGGYVLSIGVAIAFIASNVYLAGWRQSKDSFGL